MSPPRRVIFHIGQTKAGSTSIQNYLEAERDAMLAQGVLFPLSTMKRSNPFDHSRTAGHLLLLHGLKGDEIMQAFEQELASHPHHTLVLSVENMFSDQPDSVLEAMGRYFSADALEVWAVLRPQFDWLRSRHIENTLSGFSSRTDSFARFVQNAAQEGILDYPARLRHVAGLLGAGQIRAIPFTSDEGPLVTRFLQAAGLPVTDPDAAASQHSNIREKSGPLVEGKRRLNAVCAGIPVPLRLEIEHAFRRLHARSFADSQEPEFCPEIPLTAAQIEDLHRANQSLADEGIMVQPLELGQAGRAGAADPMTVSQLLRQGLRAAALICDRHPERKALQGSLLRFDPEECDALAEALEAASASTHLQAPETALLAACFDRRLVRLHLTPDRGVWRQMARLDGLMSPSPLVALAADKIGETGDPLPDVVVIGEGVEAARVLPLLNQSRLRQLILLEGARTLLPDLPLGTHQRRDVGRCLFLTKPVQVSHGPVRL